MLEMEKVKKEEAEAECQLQKLKTRNEDFEVPPTKDYILQKSKVDELRQKAKTWRRKVEIAEMKLKTVRSNWRVLCNKQNLGEIHVEGLEGGAGDQQVGGGSGNVSWFWGVIEFFLSTYSCIFYFCLNYKMYKLKFSLKFQWYLIF